MTGRCLVACVVVLLVALAGCSGGDFPPADPTDGAGGDGVADAFGDEGSGDGGSSDSGVQDARGGEDDAVSQWERFSFEEGEYYRYRVNVVGNDETATITWDVQSVDGGDVTADATYDDGDRSVTRTVTGENASILWDLRDVDYESDDADAVIQMTSYLTLGPFSPLTAYYEHRELAVGNSWRLSGTPDAGYMTANVEGRNQYAGLNCYETAIRVPDSDEWDG